MIGILAETIPAFNENFPLHPKWMRRFECQMNGLAKASAPCFGRHISITGLPQFASGSGVTESLEPLLQRFG